MKYLSSILLIILVVSCSDSNDIISEISKTEIQCPDGAIKEMDNWSKSGTSLSCKMKHGKFVAWENGYKHVSGSFHLGRKSGIWQWCDESGAITKTVDYGSAVNQQP